MNTRLGKSFGLAFVVAVGILALMFALGTFNAQKASAQDVVDKTVSVQPQEPSGGEVTYVRVNFDIEKDTGSVVSGQEISITLNGFEIPADIPTSEVSIRATEPASTGSPAYVTVSDSTITLEVGSDSDGVPMEIGAGTVSVIFTKRVGITAPVAAGDYAVTVDAGGVSRTNSKAVIISRTVTISPDSGDSATNITVTGTSFLDGTANIYVNQDTSELKGPQPTSGSIATVSISGGKFTTTVAATPGNYFKNGANSIDVWDAGGIGARSSEFTLNGKVDAPETLVKGTKGVTVKLTEGPTATTSVAAVKIGGVAVSFGGENDLSRNVTGGGDDEKPVPLTAGSVTIKIDVPSTVGSGSKKLALYTANDTELGSTKVEITALALSLTPSTAVPGQTVDLDGSGFTTSGEVLELKVDDADVDPTPDNKATTNGRFFITFKVPDVGDGTHTVQLEDKQGKIGEGTLTVPKPTITIDPATGRRGTSVTVSGTGFPAGDSIIVTYAGEDSGFARSDSSGAWETVITVPPIAEIGKESNIVAEREVNESDKKASRKSDAVKHMVPESELTLSAVSAPSGEMITITGTGFPPYSGITVEFGSNGASPLGVNTDENGDFTAQVQVPLLTPGTSHLVKVVVKGEIDKVVTELFTIATKPVVTTKSSADAFADLVAADNLIVVWHFDNGTKAWSFYDPRPAVAAAVDLTEVDTGDNVWIQITADQMFQGEMLTAGWNLVTLD